MEEIIVKEVLEEKLTESEKLQLKRWLNQSVANRRLYHQIRLSMLSPGNARRNKLKDEVWKELATRMKPVKKPGDTKILAPYLDWLKIAAMIMVFGTLLLISYRFWDSRSEPNVVEVKFIEKVSLHGQKVTTQLPDGTSVRLNSGSKLIVPELFSEDSREVTLYGEAFFDVEPDKNRPFRINTKDIQVEVLGTSFNVKSYMNEDKTEVAVSSGKVSVGKDKSFKYLASGEKISYTSLHGLSTKLDFNPEEEFGWKDNLLIFNESNLREVTDILARWYGVEFQIESTQLKIQKKYSARYKDPNLRSVLEGLTYVYNMTYEIDNKKIILKMKS